MEENLGAIFQLNTMIIRTWLHACSGLPVYVDCAGWEQGYIIHSVGTICAGKLDLKASLKDLRGRFETLGHCMNACKAL